VITVVIVDDHTAFRAAARRMLEASGFAVVGEAGDAAAALATVAETRPDLVLLDVQLPGVDGFAVAERLATSTAPPRVVMTSSRDAAVYADRLARAPVCAFIPKLQLTGPALAATLA
jgi:DNA-binding NarL/FixJ family response regulator